MKLTEQQDITGSQSVDRALSLLSLVARGAHRGMSLNEIVEASGFNKTTCRRLLLALMRARLVDQDELERRYYLGEEAYVVGVFAAPRFGLLEFSLESLIRISRKTGDAAFVSIRRHTHALCLHREDGTYPIRSHFLQKGHEHPLGIGAGSLAMLAALEDAEIEAVMAYNASELARNFPSISILDIRKALAVTRAKGYAINPGLVHASAWGIGVALAYPDGRLAGSLSIATIDSRLQEPRQAELAALLREEAAFVEAKLARAVGTAARPGPRNERGGASFRQQKRISG